jgi:acyl-CoA synthetase (NDP forming)
VLDIPKDDIELAVITIPASAVIKVIDECGQKGIKAAIVISAGFAEVGEKGRLLQDELVRVAKSRDIRIIGPNGMGVWSATSRLCLPFDPPPKNGTIAFVSQSGTFGGFLVSVAGTKGYGFSRFVSAGNQADVNAADYLEYLDEDPETKAIVFYLEGLKDGRRFMEVARDVVRHKPIAVYKAGRSDAGGKATLSHTGSLSGSDAVFDSMCKQLGILRTQEPLQTFDVAEALSRLPLPRGKRVWQMMFLIQIIICRQPYSLHKAIYPKASLAMT